MEVVHADVDGVPAVWLPGEGALQAGLVFRVGRADESLARGGLTHLVEHLVLHGVGQSDYHFNGATGPITTTFYTRGDADELSQFFTAVCAGLRQLPEERLETEKAILRTEASGRGQAVAHPLWRWRYGPAGFGLCGYDEFGLGDLTIDDLRNWSGRWFTRGNAAFWIVGGLPPDGVRLDLPDGPRQPAPAAPMVLPRTPAYVAAMDDDGYFGESTGRSRSATCGRPSST
jgi:zinc protease